MRRHVARRATERSVAPVWILVFSALALGVAAPRPAAAQINPFRSSFANGLTNGDFERLMDASNALLAREVLAVGATEPWKNPQTGAGGTIEVVRSFTHAGMACQTLLYSTLPDESHTARQTRLDWCHTKDGWRIL